ncbi:nucleoid-associated protein [Oceaniserpentilla sp. 4NH20-0058]|uniref:nucleoid-associated protein n=1 Tax=Oceaniserpentilla sp. 4NH20-0058 TaxID=3127660 RepID=UPI0031035165
MFDFTHAYIKESFANFIGNKARNEEIFLSSSPLTHDQTLDKHLMHLFLDAFLSTQGSFVFHHEEDINLNEAYIHTDEYFAGKYSLHSLANKLSKLLYRVSTHPNILSGELFITRINDIRINKKQHDIIGIFKSEQKKNLIHLEQSDTKLNAKVISGISPDALDKGAIIVPANAGYRIFIFNRKKADSIYWNESFLGCIPEKDTFLKTKHCIDACLQFHKKHLTPSENPKSSIEINNSIYQYFNENKKFSSSDFAESIGLTKAQTSEFHDHIERYESKNNIKLSSTFKLDSTLDKKLQSKLKKNLKLDNSIEIKIPLNEDSAKKNIEKGYDNSRKMSYYKIYFHEES